MSIEQKSNDTNFQNLVTVLALCRAGRIKLEDVGPENAMVLGYYRGLMEDDSIFKAEVIKRQNEICLGDKQVRKTSLFTPEELEKAKKHRKRKKTVKGQSYLQSELWQDTPDPDMKPYSHGQIIDPEAKMFKEFEKINSRFLSCKDTYIPAEMKYKRNELRGIINLPIARGKDPHANDSFYRFLVKNIVSQDSFGIFEEYGQVMDNIPESLSSKIEEVRTFIDKVLVNDLNSSQKYKEYHQFLGNYLEEWRG